MAELLYYINYLRDRPCAPCCHFQRRILMWMSPDLSCHQRLVYLTVRCRYVSFGMNVYGGSFLHLQYLSYLYILSFCLVFSIYIFLFIFPWKIKQVGNYPCKTGHFPAFLLDWQPQILLIYYWRLSLDTPKIQEMQSYSFDWTSLPLYNEAKKGRWNLWGESSIIYMWTVEKGQSCCKALWSWKTNSYSRADTGTAWTSWYSRSQMHLSRKWKLNMSNGKPIESRLFLSVKSKRLFCVLW